MTEVIRTEYLKKMSDYFDRPDLIKIITGVRRSGKSTLMRQFGDILKEKGIGFLHLDMESMRYDIVSERDMYGYLSERSEEGGCILLDEVQIVSGWENVINTLRANGRNIYVTGSNAKVLSSEFSTIIAGRYVQIHVLPFSFKEFIERYPVTGTERTEYRFRQFMNCGGLPVIDLNDDVEKNLSISEGVYDSIVNRDIIARTGLNPGVVRRMTDFMYANTGNIITLDALRKGLGMLDRRTVERYLDAITDSFVFYKVKTYDLIGKKLMKVKAKYYPSDTGMRNVSVGHSDDNMPGILENVVFLELTRRGYDVVIGCYRDREVDFTVRKNGIIEFYQVSLTLKDKSTMERERRVLDNLPDDGKKIILTLDSDLPDSDSVQYVNAIDWLLE